MASLLSNCWEIKGCGRQKNGMKVAELGECIASKEELGHSCWVIAGTLCGGKIQGTAAQKEGNCMLCEVYKKYHRITGTEGKRVRSEYPAEEAKYKNIVLGKTSR